MAQMTLAGIGVGMLGMRGTLGILGFDLGLKINSADPVVVQEPLLGSIPIQIVARRPQTCSGNNLPGRIEIRHTS